MGDVVIRAGADVGQDHLARVTRGPPGMIPAGVKVLVASHPVDFRKRPDGLLALVRDASSDPFNGALYVYRAKRADRVKIVWWDGSGVCLYLVIEGNDMIPATVRSALLPLVHQLSGLDAEIRQSDQAILALAKADETARRLMTIPGIGPVTASALVASIQDISAFSGPREFAAFLGLTPRQSSSGGKERLDAFPRWETDICASCSLSALMPFCSIASVPAMR